MAKAYGEGGTTHYVAEGDPVPDLPGVRLVGPGAPIQEAMQERLAAARQGQQAPEAPEAAAESPTEEAPEEPTSPTAKEEEEPAPRPAARASHAEWVDYAVGQGADRAEAESLKKAELANRYGG